MKNRRETIISYEGEPHEKKPSAPYQKCPVCGTCDLNTVKLIDHTIIQTRLSTRGRGLNRYNCYHCGYGWTTKFKM
jgi:hypothetical protein